MPWSNNQSSLQCSVFVYELMHDSHPQSTMEWHTCQNFLAQRQPGWVVSCNTLSLPPLSLPSCYCFCRCLPFLLSSVTPSWTGGVLTGQKEITCLTGSCLRDGLGSPLNLCPTAIPKTPTNGHTPKLRSRIRTLFLGGCLGECLWWFCIKPWDLT